MVGLVLKQLKPSEPSLRHDTNIRHGCQELIARVRQRQSLATVSV